MKINKMKKRIVINFFSIYGVLVGSGFGLIFNNTSVSEKNLLFGICLIFGVIISIFIYKLTFELLKKNKALTNIISNLLISLLLVPLIVQLGMIDIKLEYVGIIFAILFSQSLILSLRYLEKSITE